MFFVWGSLFSVMAVTQFWAFATDLFNVQSGERLFGLIAVGISGGAFAGAQASSALFDAIGPHGLDAGLRRRADRRDRAGRARARGDSRAGAGRRYSDPSPRQGSGRWLGGFAVVAPQPYLVGIATLVVLLNWITSAGDFVLTSWLVDIAGREAPGAETEFIGRFMGKYGSAVALAGFLIQLLLVSRIIQFAGLARALLLTPLAFAAGYLLVGIVPVFLLLQSVLVVQRSFDYSLLNTTRNALLLPMGREAKYQAKTAIDTFFFRAGDLLATGSIFAGRAVVRRRAHAVRVAHHHILSLTMLLVAWLIGREYARRDAPPLAAPNFRRRARRSRAGDAYSRNNMSRRLSTRVDLPAVQPGPAPLELLAIECRKACRKRGPATRLAQVEQLRPLLIARKAREWSISTTSSRA